MRVRALLRDVVGLLTVLFIAVGYFWAVANIALGAIAIWCRIAVALLG